MGAIHLLAQSSACASILCKENILKHVGQHVDSFEDFLSFSSSLILMAVLTLPPSHTFSSTEKRELSALDSAKFAIFQIPLAT